MLTAALCACALAGCNENGRAIDRRAAARRHRRLRVDRRPAAGAIPEAGARSQRRGADAPAGGDVARAALGLPRARLSRRRRSQNGETTISWVWDVFDGEQQRRLRIAGAETAKGRHRDAWQAVDDAMLRRIAHSSMEQLAAFLTSAESRPARPMPKRRADDADLRATLRRRRPAYSACSAAMRTRCRRRRARRTGRRAGAAAAPPATTPAAFTGAETLTLAARRPAEPFTLSRKSYGTRFRRIAGPCRLVMTTPPVAHGARPAQQGFRMAGKNGAIKLVAGNSNPDAGAAHRRVPEDPAGQGGGAALRRHGGVRRDPGKRARRRRVSCCSRPRSRPTTT